MEAAKWAAGADERAAAVTSKLVSMRTEGIRGADGSVRKITFADVAEATGVSRSAISTMVSRGLVVNEGAMEKIISFIRESEPEFLKAGAAGALDALPGGAGDETERTEGRPGQARQYKREIEIFKTREFKQALGWCDYIQSKRRMGVMIGYPGCGKTTILREYMKRSAGAKYIECWPTMRVNDLLSQIAGAAGITASGSAYQRVQQIIQGLRNSDDVMLIFDEAEYLKKWDVTKLELIRKIWDNTGAPVVLAGTPELEAILTRGSGRENLAQLYRRKYEIRLSGIAAGEVKQILTEYDVSAEAAAELIKIATDAKHGGMGNFTEILEMCLDAAGNGQIDAAIVNGAKQYKLMY